jgi:hypothetical protein
MFAANNAQISAKAILPVTPESNALPLPAKALSSANRVMSGLKNRKK